MCKGAGLLQRYGEFDAESRAAVKRYLQDASLTTRARFGVGAAAYRWCWPLYDHVLLLKRRFSPRHRH
jgi:hypothetical protein